MTNDLKKEECIELLHHNYIARLAYISGACPYILPITYFLEEDGKSIIGYTSKGHKISAMRENAQVCLQVDEIKSMDKWGSVQVQGRFEELHGSDAKYHFSKFAQGVKYIVSRKEKTNPAFISDFSSKVNTGDIPIVYRINVMDIKGKFRDA